jgi:hypothetical protein
MAQAPQHLVADVRLPSIERSDDPAMRLGAVLEPERSGPRACDEFVVALPKMQARPWRHGDQAPPPLLMELGQTAGRGMAQRANQRDAIETKLVRGSGESAFCLGSVRVLDLGTRRRDAPTNLEREPYDVGQCRDRALGCVHK